MARKAGEALRGFKDYLADYDLKARGAGSDKKKGPVSRFSGLDVRHVFDNRGEGAVSYTHLTLPTIRSV